MKASFSFVSPLAVELENVLYGCRLQWTLVHFLSMQFNEFPSGKPK